MNNGEFYTQIKNTEDGQEIIKYSFKNGNRIVRLFKSSDFKIKRINSYSLSDDDELMRDDDQLTNSCSSSTACAGDQLVSENEGGC